MYRVHFGVSRTSKYFPQLMELCRLADSFTNSGEDPDDGFEAEFRDDQIELLASVYQLAVKMPYPCLHGADIRSIFLCCRGNGEYRSVPPSEKKTKKVKEVVEILRGKTGLPFDALGKRLRELYMDPIERDMMIVREKIIKEGYIDHRDPKTGGLIRASKKPKEPLGQFQDIKDCITRGEYSGAVKLYYTIMGDRPYGELTPELIYLKRLGDIPLSARDLLYYRPVSSRRGLVEENLSEYLSCVDQTLEKLPSMGRKSPLDILIEHAPTMEQKVRKLEDDWHLGVYLWDGEFKRDSTPVTLNKFSATFDFCPEGRIFERYPDQVQHCREFEYTPDTRSYGVWTLYAPEFVRKEIIEKGLHLNGIRIHKLAAWKKDYKFKRTLVHDPDFTSAHSSSELLSLNCGAYQVDFTGRIHVVEGKRYFEINLIFNKEREDVGNSFMELVEEILREAENLLRERHGLPRIGEGWVSETQLYQLIKRYFPDAQQHVSPDWLSPQHLDVFVPSLNLAIEYQGRQHFEPVEYFGGDVSFTFTVKRDRVKARKCKQSSVRLLEWPYTDAIEDIALKEKFSVLGIQISAE